MLYETKTYTKIKGDNLYLKVSDTSIKWSKIVDKRTNKSKFICYMIFATAIDCFNAWENECGN